MEKIEAKLPLLPLSPKGGNGGDGSGNAPIPKEENGEDGNGNASIPKGEMEKIEATVMFYTSSVVATCW